MIHLQLLLVLRFPLASNAILLLVLRLPMVHIAEIPDDEAEVEYSRGLKAWPARGLMKLEQAAKAWCPYGGPLCTRR